MSKYYLVLLFVMSHLHLFGLAVSKLDVFIDQAFTGDNGLVFSSGTTLGSSDNSTLPLLSLI